MKHVIIYWTSAAVCWWTKEIRLYKKFVYFFQTYSFSSSSNSLLIRFKAIPRDDVNLDQDLKVVVFFSNLYFMGINSEKDLEINMPLSF
jgi:hypothetical protein